jgi:hypothetical protein
VALVAGVLVACSSGQSQAPPTTQSDVACLVTLDSECCSATGGGSCIGDFDSAARCGNWTAGSKVLVYPTACGGYEVVSVKLPSSTYTSFYLYASGTGTLVAIGDDAVSNQPGSLSIECGAGPITLKLQGTCTVEWLDPTKGEACASGTSTPKSVCQ